MHRPDEDLDAATTGRMSAPMAAPFVTEDAFAIPDQPLARGGMAVVFEAADRRLPRNVILKRPRDDNESSEGERRAFVERLEAEALVLARLQHPSIVTLYELGRASGGVPFCVLQRVDGSSLRSRLDALGDGEHTGERLELVAGLVAIAEALAYAHERGIVHRDVTPGNILLGSRGEMTLIDWGLAKDTSQRGAAEPILAALGDVEDDATISAGTPPYVCYEQTQGQPADPSYDVYSLGVTLYEVVSGRPAYRWEMPADADGRERALRSFLRWAERGPTPEPAAPRDPELSGIIARAMARDASQRFTADQLVRALKQYLTGELVFSHRYSWSGRMARWARRHRGATISATVAVAAVIAAGLVWTTARAQDAERAQERARDEAIVLAQRVEAAEAQMRAAEAEGRARAAEAAAEKARLEGRESRELQAEAERLRQDAERQAKAAQEAAGDAASDASAAQARRREAIAERDAAAAARAEAEAARAVAEQERDAARAARTRAERDRDQSSAAQVAAEAAREVAERERDTAVAARGAAESARAVAERERDAAVSARGAAESARTAAEEERDAALSRIRALEAHVSELEQGGGGHDGEAPPDAGP